MNEVDCNRTAPYSSVVLDHPCHLSVTFVGFLQRFSGLLQRPGSPKAAGKCVMPDYSISQSDLFLGSTWQTTS